MRNLALLLTGLGSGVVTGVLFGFSTFVMPALARLPAAQGAAAMQAVNVAAVNVPFMTVLFGTGAVAVATAIRSPSRFTITGAALYLVGVLGVTMAANVPRNDALAAAASYWPRYLSSWVAWNHVRTFAGAVATACFLLGLTGCHTITGINRCADVPAGQAPETLPDSPDKVEYRPRFELWSDGAKKRRWISLPGKIDTSDMDSWRFPVGTKLWKEFSARETRYFEKVGESEWIGMAYIDGHAAPEGDRALGVPAARECAGCHGGVKDRVLGISAVQVDAPTIAKLGLNVKEVRVEEPALGYLHANCGHCHNQHRPSHDGPRCYDPRSEIDLSLRTTDLAAAARFVTPGDPEGSAVYRRLAGQGLEPRMPALGTRGANPEAVALIGNWIRALPR